MNKKIEQAILEKKIENNLGRIADALEEILRLIQVESNKDIEKD